MPNHPFSSREPAVLAAGDITLDRRTHADELTFGSRLMQQWPTEMRCVPGNHDLGNGSVKMPLDDRLLRAYENIFGPDHWVINAGDWELLGINAQLLGSNSAQEAAFWEWIASGVEAATDHAHTVLSLGPRTHAGQPMSVFGKFKYNDLLGIKTEREMMLMLEALTLSRASRRPPLERQSEVGHSSFLASC